MHFAYNEGPQFLSRPQRPAPSAAQIPVVTCRTYEYESEYENFGDKNCDSLAIMAQPVLLCCS